MDEITNKGSSRLNLQAIEGARRLSELLKGTYGGKSPPYYGGSHFLFIEDRKGDVTIEKLNYKYILLQSVETRVTSHIMSDIVYDDGCDVKDAIDPLFEKFELEQTLVYSNDVLLRATVKEVGRKLRSEARRIRWSKRLERREKFIRDGLLELLRKGGEVRDSGVSGGEGGAVANYISDVVAGDCLKTPLQVGESDEEESDDEAGVNNQVDDEGEGEENENVEGDGDNEGSENEDGDEDTEDDAPQSGVPDSSRYYSDDLIDENDDLINAIFRRLGASPTVAKRASTQKEVPRVSQKEKGIIGEGSSSKALGSSALKRMCDQMDVAQTARKAALFAAEKDDVAMAESLVHLCVSGPDEVGSWGMCFKRAEKIFSRRVKEASKYEDVPKETILSLNTRVLELEQEILQADFKRECLVTMPLKQFIDELGYDPETFEQFAPDPFVSNGVEDTSQTPEMV
ncbi:hypothetical protein GIB67_024108 [Kingdonia uniflora]|uniref:Uncharacterized protein n=1 Tax=Kingdonia uniflora TaxID=39325 RepID=A0A7J7MN45_9MAGN|nr:hypothetical protein GIB67_024108 [Kingdonia uniflora]